MIKTFIFDIFVLIQPAQIPTVVNLQLNCNCDHSNKGLSDITLGQQTKKKNFLILHTFWKDNNMNHLLIKKNCSLNSKFMISLQKNVINLFKQNNRNGLD